MKNFKKGMIPVALAAALSLSAFLVACGGDDDGNTDKWRDQSIWLQQDALVPTEAAEIPESSEYRSPAAAVHDPSIFRDPADGAYYAFGTHYAVAKTYDFADEWEQLVSDNDFEKLYGNGRTTYGGKAYPTAIQETVELVKPTSTDASATTWSTWAPDVEYINGKYYMYYSFTKAFGSHESAIGRVEADNVMGPYSNNTIVIDSMGATRGRDPNCIDPELFYDKEGKLWMVYGSDSGGIFIKELETEGERAGLPKKSKEEEGFGKKLWKGGSNQEGPFVYYNASTDYYYLMVSYNSLMSNYNMHVARSKNPDGPYVGMDGKDVAAEGDGNLVAGNFKMNRSGTSGNGMAAMGHNSVIKDKDGKYFLVYHSRTTTSTGAVSQPHKLFVNQILFNEDGWPVMAPTPYAGETRGTMTEEQLATTYDLVVHKMPTRKAEHEATFEKSAEYVLTADGKITGSGVTDGDGRTLKEGYYIEITLKGVTYKGVVAPGWDSYSNTAKKGVVTFTAASAVDGTALWAIQK